MVQDSSTLATFFPSHIAKNAQYSPEWGNRYRQLVERIQAEMPDFSAETI